MIDRTINSRLYLSAVNMMTERIVVEMPEMAGRERIKTIIMNSQSYGFIGYERSGTWIKSFWISLSKQLKGSMLQDNTMLS